MEKEIVNVLEFVENNDVKVLPFDQRLNISLKLNLIHKISQREAQEITGINRQTLRK